ILGSTSTTVNGGATDQDSTEKRIRREIEEEDTSDTLDSSDSEEEIDEDICTEIVPEKKQTVSPSYIKSCSQTQIKTNSILDHTWKINQFMWLYNTVKTMTYVSPPFPETGQYRIQMKVLPRTSYYSGTYNVVCFYILTSNTFNALCTTTISLLSGKVLSSKSISGPISNNTLLIEIQRDLDKLLSHRDELTIHCKFEFFCNLINKTIRLNSLPSSNKVSENVTYFEDLTFDEFCSKNKTASEKKSVDRK
ncbi:uncharacterized protein LOC112455545, partial [Temnothorax curvispinosus]|uniref:Uncharacterized protein LOC112455545 n=1 Tax=Temnothorax curvispinosus TaxID=300111 RepID=A0A6J1PVF0_9HYME